MDQIKKTPETLTLENGRSPVAELNELTNALAKWKISERNDDGMIKGKPILFEVLSKLLVS